MRCISSVKFGMFATVLNRYDNGDDVESEVKGGHWETIQDPETNSITRVWVEDAVAPQLPGQTRVANIERFDIECVVRGFNEVGFRSSANTEFFTDGRYIPFEVVQMTFPSKYILNRGQYITNIRSRNKKLLWMEEETGMPTVFDVQGVTPQFDPFNRHIENLAVLRRSPIQ